MKLNTLNNGNCSYRQMKNKIIRNKNYVIKSKIQMQSNKDTLLEINKTNRINNSNRISNK